MRALGLGALLLVAACHAEDIDAMERQPKAKPYRSSNLFPDGRSMRTPPAGAIPRERDLDEAAPETTLSLLERGRARFDVTCANCHGVAGDGDSAVASKMSLRPPPSLHEPRLRDLDDAALYRVVSEGYGVMPPMAMYLPPRDRWAVVSYVRALQLSQNLPLAEAPEATRRQIEGMK